MAVTSILSCSACERIILPGDTFGIVSTVVLIRTTPDSVEFEDRNPGSTVHYCATCSQAASEAIAGLAQDLAATSEVMAEEPDEDYAGFGVTEDQYREAVLNLDLVYHAKDTGETPCSADECSYADNIKDELQRMGALD